MTDRFLVRVELWAPMQMSRTEVAEMVHDKLRSNPDSALIIGLVHADRSEEPL